MTVLSVIVASETRRMYVGKLEGVVNILRKFKMQNIWNLEAVLGYIGIFCLVNNYYKESGGGYSNTDYRN